MTEETKRKIGLANKGKKKPPRSEEHRQRQRIAMLGKKWSNEQKEKNRQSHLGENAYNWKGGLNRNYERNHNPEYKYALSVKTSICEICLTPESTLRTKLNFDHNHKTGKFRGWICWSCNMALGFAKDNAEILQSMSNYIKKSRSNAEQ